MAIRTAEQAELAVQTDAANRALIWIEREIPSTLAAIIFWVQDGKLSNADIMKKIVKSYDMTEEKVQHKIRLVVEATRRASEE